METKEKNRSDFSIRCESINDILTAIPSRFIRWGSGLLLMLIVMVIVLSWIIKYPDTIKAEGYLTTEMPPQKVFSRVSAKMDTLFVKEGQHIEKNTILAVLENSANNQDVLYLAAVMDTIIIDENKVYFPFEKLPILFLGELETDFSDFENSYYEYLLNKDLQPHSNRLLANEYSQTELKNRYSNLIKQQELNKKQLQLMETDLDRHKKLLEKGIIAQKTYEEKQMAYYAMLKSYESNGLVISQLKQSLSTNKNDAENLAYTKQREELKLLKNVIQSYGKLKNAIKAWELKYTLKTNLEGRVLFLDHWRENQSISEGELVFMVTPEANSGLVARLQTSEQSSGKIKTGQEVHIKLKDYPEHEFGILQGQIIQIADVSNTMGSYMVDVALPMDLKTTYGKYIEFKQEMHVTADIITEDLRLLERLLYQFKDLFSR